MAAWFHDLIFEVLIVVMMVKVSKLEFGFYTGNVTKELRE